jgi:hypothetical protein
MHAAVLGLLLLVRIYDNAGLSAADASAAERIAAEIFQSAGLGTAWVFCVPPGQTILMDPPACADTPSPSTLLIRVVRRPPAQEAAGALAGASVDTAAVRGTLATLYLEPLTAFARRAKVDRGTLVGWTMAHELGHLLLGTAAHSREGLMRAQWSTAMLRHPARAAWQFSPEEAALLVERLADRDPRRQANGEELRVSLR